MKNTTFFRMGMTVFLWTVGLQSVHAMSPQELAEVFCDYYDGVSCQFEEKSGAYKFGSTHFVYGGNGKIRSEAAYCLLRDGDGHAVNASLGEDWYRFGGTSRVHVTYAGKDSSGLYQAEGQRIFDLVLFGKTLEGIEVQDYQAGFPIEKEKAKKPTCKKWIQTGRGKVCAQPGVSLSEREGYYMTLDTQAYQWEIDIDEIAGDLSQLFGGPPMPEGLEIALGQKVPFQYYGTTELSGADLIFNDGIIPYGASSGNLWDWGLDPEGEDHTSYLDVELPIVDADFASLTLYADVGLNGFYRLQEGPIITDPDSGQMDNPLPLEELTTSTHLEAGAAVSVILEACLDFGWFGDWCGDFALVDEQDISKRDPLNEIAYSPRGLPRSSLWSTGIASDEPRTVVDQLNSCLNDETIIQEPEDMAHPGDVVGFMSEVSDTIADHFEPCYVTEPDNTVQYSGPSFKLCDDAGRVYEAVSGLHTK